MTLAQLARCVICLAICTVNYNVILLGSTCGDVGLACSGLDHAMRYRRTSERYKYDTRYNP